MKKQSLAILAVASLMSQNLSTATANFNEAKRQAANKEMAAASRDKTMKLIAPFIGGIQMAHVGGGGVPPHIYGQSFVRRATHKRTNRK